MKGNGKSCAKKNFKIANERKAVHTGCSVSVFFFRLFLYCTPQRSSERVRRNTVAWCLINNRIIRYSNWTIAQHLDRPFSTRFCTAFHSSRRWRHARNPVLRAQDIVLLNVWAAHHDATVCAQKGKVLHDRWVRDNQLQKVAAASAKNTTQKVC